MGGTGARFSGLNLVAQDFEATVDFYRMLGITLPDEKIWRTDSGPHHSEGVTMGAQAEVELDSPELARVYNAGYAISPAHPTTILSFALADRAAVDDLYEQLISAGHQSRQPPFDAFWGSRYAIVADPDGRDVALMSPPDAAKRSAPPDL
jgi:uncharacterized glyoxalase superfamily protein PhnB